VKYLIALFALAVGPAWAVEPIPRDAIYAQTTPPGATVELNRKVIGVTPLIYKVGEYAFNVRKSSLFSKRLATPVTLHITLDGFEPKDIEITKQYQWASFNGQNRFWYFIITRQEWSFKLDKITDPVKVLTNADVVELWSAGFSGELIVQKIQTTATAFSLNIPDLVKLREAGIPDPVIQAMMQKSTPPEPGQQQP
jgi:hypothetical protein